MNKFRGKALATVLAAALVASSLPVTFASAKTAKHSSGVLTKDPDNDEFWLVNGGSSKDDRSIENFQEKIYDGSAPLETADHQDVDDPEVYSISHVSGDKLVSWDIGKDDDNNDDDQDKGDVKLSLRKSDSEGDEVIAVLYKGTYTDDDDNDVDITASTKITIHAVDENSTVIGDASKVKDGYYDYGTDPDGTDSPELDGNDDDDDNFARKTTNGKPDSKAIAVFKAERANYLSDNKQDGKGETDKGCLAEWKMMPTISEQGAKDATTDNSESTFLHQAENAYAYVLESNNTKDIKLEDSKAADTEDASVKSAGVAGEAKLADNKKDVEIDSTGDGTLYYGVAADSETPPTTKVACASDTTTLTGGDDIKDGNILYLYNSNAEDAKTIGKYTFAAAVPESAATVKAEASKDFADISEDTVKAKYTGDNAVTVATDTNGNVIVTNAGSNDLYCYVNDAFVQKDSNSLNLKSASKEQVLASGTEAKVLTFYDADTTGTDSKPTGTLLATYNYTPAKTSADATLSANAAKPDVTVEPTTQAVKAGVTITNNSANNIYYTVNENDPTKGTVVAANGGTAPIASDKISNGNVIYIFEGKTATSKEVEGYGEFTYYAGEAEGTPNNYVIASVQGTGTANLTLKAKVTNAYKSVVNKDDDIKAKVKVEKKVLVNDDSASYKIFKNDTYRDTVIEGDESKGFKGDEKNGTDHSEMDIDGGYIVKFVDKIGTNSATATFKADASVDSITGKITSVKVDDAKKVGTINLKAGSVSIEDSDVKVDGITTKADSGISDPKISVDADNNVGTITVKKDNDGASEVDMTAGTAKAINTKGTVNLNGGEDDKPVTVGTVTARDITIDSTDGAVSVANIVSNAPDGNENGCVIELDGDEATVKSIDFAGFGTDLKTNDFQGTIPAPQNAKAEDATLETTDEDDSFNVTGDLDIDTVNIDEDDSDVTFDGKLSVKELEGGGTMYIGANKLYVGDDASGVLVRITDNSIKAGDTIFTAKSDAVDDNDIDFYGFTVKCNEGKTTDTFVVDQLKFAGLAMNKTADKIVLNDSATYTASAYAPGTSLPEGYSIAFDMDDNSGVFELTDNGNGTAAVKCVDFDDTFAEENKATLKAYVVDEDGDEDDDYGEATCKLTALKTPEKNFVSDTNNDFSIAPGASYQFKITADAAPVMTAGTAGVVNVANVGMSGKDYFIKITATGAKGAKTGIYVNGAKLLVVTVGTSQTFKSDTTTAVTVKKGSSYQYGITTSDGKAPFFTVGTGSVFNVKANGHNGSTYFFKITAAGKAGAQAGIYVNGTKVNVAKIG